jgi:hypothetical protein
VKKILLITISILLAACGVVQPVQQEQPTPVVQTVEVVQTVPVVQTVVVTVVAPTNTPEPTPVATETLVPTLPPQPTEALPTVDPATSNNGLVPVNVGNDLGKGVFINITFSSDIVSLRCFPREMQITITPNLQDIREAVLYYRIVDKPAGLYPSEWQNLGEMQEDSNGNFIFTFKGETIHPNFRVLEEAWIDFQFIGINRGGGVVDRTQKIERLVTYYKDCP